MSRFDIISFGALVLKSKNMAAIMIILVVFSFVSTIMIIYLNGNVKSHNQRRVQRYFDSKHHNSSLTIRNIFSDISHLRKIKSKRDLHLGELHGGPAKCQLYKKTERDYQKQVDNCILLKMEQVFICTHPLTFDKHISFSLVKDDLWEEYSLNIFKQILLSDKELGVFDIGANIGIYSIVAASLGHKVVAIEPHVMNLEKLYMGIKMNKIDENVIVLHNAISNKRGAYELFVPHDNQGGIHLTSQDVDIYCENQRFCPPWASTIVMNDLLEITNFERAIIKIDIEGHEHKALRISKLFFKYVKVTHILMEWQNLRRYYGSDSEDKRLILDMFSILKKRHFCPIDMNTNYALSLNHWYGWPDDVIWVHSNFSLNGIFVCK